MATKSRSLLSVLRREAWGLPEIEGPDIKAARPIAEEAIPGQRLSNFYPAYLGEVIQDRYQLVCKLGCGRKCTVWLARVIKGWKWLPEKFVVIKVGVVDKKRKASADHELNMLRHMTKVNASGKRCNVVRELLDHFYIFSGAGEHLCMIFAPLREPLSMFRPHLPDYMGPPIKVINVVSGMMLSALNFLHTRCGVIHCDIRDENVVLGFRNEKVENRVLMGHALIGWLRPLPVKRLTDRTIYLEHNEFGGLAPGTIGRIYLTNLGSAVRPDQGVDCIHECQPPGMQAPEVIMRQPWSYSVDVWNLGCFIAEMVEGRPIFGWDDRKEWSFESRLDSLARMVSFLGPPPKSVLDGVDMKVFGEALAGEDGEEDWTFENYFTTVQGEEKTLLIAFLKRMLRWDPGERATPAELLDDPWLHINRAKVEANRARAGPDVKFLEGHLLRPDHLKDF